ncbi:MAG: ABC transporter ATP-binding protein [Vicinamibacterales bacterium]
MARPKRHAWTFFAILSRAAPGLSVAWWTMLVLRGLLPVAFALSMGALVSAVQSGTPLGPSLALVGIVFIALQVLAPVHQALNANLGDRTAAFLYDRLTDACVSPTGIAHLEDPALASDLTAARDFDLGMTGPPLAVSMDFITTGMVEMLAGLGSVALLAGFAWWAPLVVGGAWISTHWLLRDSSIWRDRHTEPVRAAQRDAEYAYRLAVEAAPSKEIRLFGLAGWTLERFVARRTLLHELQYDATRLRERPVLWSLLLVGAANLLVFWALADAALGGRLGLGALVVDAQAAAGASLIAFGGLSWAFDATESPMKAMTVGPAMREVGALPSGVVAADGLPRREIRFREVTFAYPGARPVLERFDLTIPVGSSLAIVGVNGAGKTTLAKLLCRLYDPQSGSIEVDGVDLRSFAIDAWRRRVTAVFQDFLRFERSLRENVAPLGAPDEVVVSALAHAGASGLASLDTVLSRAYDGGTDLSGGQWQRVALARALCAVSLGAGVVVLDEPTAQLDVRGEAEIFERILAATRACTTILISHRFSTVRQADRIAVLEAGRVVELGTHDELMALGGRYRTMFDLQAERFAALEEEVGITYDTL